MGSKPQWNLWSEEDVDSLRRDDIWLQNYYESVRLATLAWGWDIDQRARVPKPVAGMRWTNWDVRLAKMCRSLYLFEEEGRLASLQAFARDLQANEKGGKGFFYGSI